MVRQVRRGFTLVETAIVLALLALLALLIVPLGTGWADSANVRQAHSALLGAVARAKAHALRNASAANSGAPAALLVVSGGTLCVHDGTPASLGCANAAWSTPLSAEVRLAGQSTHCVAFGSHGLPLAATVGGTACAQAPAYIVTKGSQSVTGTLI
ncbi:prepilin-type N-terminal cleavage/methylation domain-containing protein [Crenobacter luteus]|uniref:pilus assembly FimT family protein n=1 Tax=Crenobacter luteus TaxID=1452487 RepID=UPI0010433ADC|nr:prepilin-type N-terminal cleavage/methylation domain-containing protein [Crenobacter luteus]TCP09416.1 prepilin-type N-terminal cleavage/methylation domain-containing protein [Crenobacter luteus]